MNLDRMIPAFALIAACLVFLLIDWRYGCKSQKALVVVSPGFIFILGVLGRYGMGCLIISLLPAEMVINGEFNQYVTAWEYSSDVAWLWLLFLIFFGIAFVLVTCSIAFSSKKDREVAKVTSILLHENERSSDKRDRRQLKITAVVLLGMFFVGSVSASVTGSFDRGLEYDYWASQPFRPEAAFIAVIL